MRNYLLGTTSGIGSRMNLRPGKGAVCPLKNKPKENSTTNMVTTPPTSTRCLLAWWCDCLFNQRVEGRSAACVELGVWEESEFCCWRAVCNFQTSCLNWLFSKFKALAWERNVSASWRKWVTSFSNSSIYLFFLCLESCADSLFLINLEFCRMK